VKSSEAAKKLWNQFSWQASREWQTMNCVWQRMWRVISLMRSCSVRKVHHRYISQYFKVQGKLEFIGHQLVTSSMFFSEPLAQWKTTYLFGC